MRVVFIQCVGSREEGHQYCSRVCCRESVKNALALKRKQARTRRCTCCSGTSAPTASPRATYQEARDAGVIFLRFTEEHKPEVDKGRERPRGVGPGRPHRRHDPHRSPTWWCWRHESTRKPGNEEVSQLFKVPLNQDGFFLEAHVKLRPVDFATEGVYLAGMAHNPKTDRGERSSRAGRRPPGRPRSSAKDKYLAEATIAAVNEDLCDGCGICVGVCEYNALEIVEQPDGSKLVKLNEAACKGCGCCVAACPSGAMEQKGYKNDQIMAEIDAALL